jgi:hypothetical protein
MVIGSALWAWMRWANVTFATTNSEGNRIGFRHGAYQARLDELNPR